MDDRRCERAEHEEQAALQPAAQAARLDQRAGDDHRGRLHEHVAIADVREFVRKYASSSAGGAAASKPRLTAIAPPRGPRPADSARGNPSASTYRRGFGTVARPARAATVACTAGASPTGSSRAPTIPSTTRSPYQ